jgi:threonyl-tRNA synthetase
LGFKIREAQLQKMPYMLIIGDQEMKERTLSVRLRNGAETKGVRIDDFIQTITTEVKSRAIKSLDLHPKSNDKT